MWRPLKQLIKTRSWKHQQGRISERSSSPRTAAVGYQRQLAKVIIPHQQRKLYLLFGGLLNNPDAASIDQIKRSGLGILFKDHSIFGNHLFLQFFSKHSELTITQTMEEMDLF